MGPSCSLAQHPRQLLKVSEGKLSHQLSHQSSLSKLCFVPSAWAALRFSWATHGHTQEKPYPDARAKNNHCRQPSVFRYVSVHVSPRHYAFSRFSPNRNIRLCLNLLSILVLTRTGDSLPPPLLSTPAPSSHSRLLNVTSPSTSRPLHSTMTHPRTLVSGLSATRYLGSAAAPAPRVIHKSLQSLPCSNSAPLQTREFQRHCWVLCACAEAG